MSSGRLDIRSIALGAFLALSCARFVTGFITPEHFQFAQMVVDDGEGLGGGWQAVCIKATLRDGDTGRMVVCDFEVGVPLRNGAQGVISRRFAQMSAAVAANNAAHVLLSQLQAGTMLGSICGQFRPVMQAELNASIAGARVRTCADEEVPTVLFDGSRTLSHMSDFELEDFLRAAWMFYLHEMPVGEAYREAPEHKRYAEAWRKALANHGEWQAIVSRLRPKLPNAGVSETTAPRFMAARRCCIYMTRLAYAEQKEPYTIVVALASILVPYYHIYRIAVDYRDGKLLRGPALPRSHGSPEGAVADTVASHLEQELGFKEFPPEYEAVPVPDIWVGNLPVGKATLLDALFDEDRGNIP